jgi:hypothetical protein
MRYSKLVALTVCAFASSNAMATDFGFGIDPFAGSTALATPGRQVVGGEPSISFDIANDRFVVSQLVFAVGGTVNFANAVAGSLAPSGLNVIVLESFDDDANAATPFGAGSAANLIASQVTTDGAGFFIYFNSGLNLPRLVYSTNLNDNTADLKILARMTNLTGNSAALPGFGAKNFSIVAGVVPEPSTWAMMICGFALAGGALRRRNLVVSYA